MAERSSKFYRNLRRIGWISVKPLSKQKAWAFCTTSSCLGEEAGKLVLRKLPRGIRNGCWFAETPQFQPVLQIINCWIFIETRLDVCKSNHRNTCDASAALWSRSASAIPRTYLLANWTDQRICVWSSLVLGMVDDKKDGSFGHGSKHAILYMIYYYIPYLVEYGINIHVPAAWMSPGVPGSWRRAVWSWCKFQPWPPGKNPPSTHPFVDGYPHSFPLPAYCNILILYMACKWHIFSYLPVASHDSHVKLLFF